MIDINENSKITKYKHNEPPEIRLYDSKLKILSKLEKYPTKKHNKNNIPPNILNKINTRLIKDIKILFLKLEYFFLFITFKNCLII